MSDTTGWTRQEPGCYTKIIDGVEYKLQHRSSWWKGPYWAVFAGTTTIHGYQTGRIIRSLPDAKRAAHEHARAKS